MPETVSPSDILTCICAFCGRAITAQEVEMEFAGTFVDYCPTSKGTGSGSFVLCVRCRNQVMKALEGDMEHAIKVREYYEEQMTAAWGDNHQ